MFRRPSLPQVSDYAGGESNHACAALSDIFANLECSGELPDGRKHRELSKMTRDDLRAYASSVLKNEAFWEKLPQDVPSIAPGITLSKHALRTQLWELLFGKT